MKKLRQIEDPSSSGSGLRGTEISREWKLLNLCQFRISAEWDFGVYRDKNLDLTPSVGKSWSKMDHSICLMPSAQQDIPKPAFAQPEAVLMREVKALKEVGKYFSAWKLIENLTPLESWENVEWQCLGISVLERIGGGKRVNRLRRQLWRLHSKRSAEVRDQMSWMVMSLRGAMGTWEWRKANVMPYTQQTRDLSNEWIWKGYLLGALRDFQRAEEALTHAESIEPDYFWLWLIRGLVEKWQDRHEMALVSLKKAYQLNPCSPGAIHALAEIYLDLGQDDEALNLLKDAVSRLEAASLPMSLYQLQFELEDWQGAQASLDLVERWSPCSEEGDFQRQWLLAQRCNLACQMGNYAEASQLALQIQDSEFYQSLGARLSGDLEGLQKKRLNVGFVRQHHMTCVPATLTTLANYWNRSVSHLETAEEICYDGTALHSQRLWAEKNHWYVKEFTITPEALKTLIDHEIPFALSTVDEGSAHCQAVIGYDEFRGVMLIRDSNHRSKLEFRLEEGLKEQASSGPRGFVMVPRDQAYQLENLELPESAWYDLSYQVQLSLEKHERSKAFEIYQKLELEASDHRITWQTLNAIASYDRDEVTSLKVVEALHRLFPEDVNLQLRRFQCLSVVVSEQELKKQLRESLTRFKSSVLLMGELARILAKDSRTLDEAGRLFQRCRRIKLDAWTLYSEANVLWQQQKHEEARELYRVAFCLEDKNESLALAYFGASKSLGKTEEALDWLKRRFELLAHKSSYPVRAYFEALESLDRIGEAFQVLEDQLKLRPEDKEFRLYYAERLLNWGQLDKSREILEALNGVEVRESAKQRVLAQLATQALETEEALERWQAVLNQEPLARDAHESMARLKAYAGGVEAAVEHYRELTQRFPFHLGLLKDYVAWAQALGPEAGVEALDSLLQAHPDDAWATRELAMSQVTLQQYDAANQTLKEAKLLEPKNALNDYIEGFLHYKQGHTATARTHWKASLENSVENAAAMNLLVYTALDESERQKDLLFLRHQLTKQRASGDAITNYVGIAVPYIPQHEMEHFLKQWHEERPESWQISMALVQCLARAQRWEEVMTHAADLKSQFPLHAQVWYELGQVYRSKPDFESAIEAYQQALALAPAWPDAAVQLSLALSATSQKLEARLVLEKALRHSPLNATLHGSYAEWLYGAGEELAAIQHVKQAIQLRPNYEWAWRALDVWGREQGLPDEARLLAYEFTQSHPNDSESWWNYASSLSQPSEFGTRLQALTRASELNPVSDRIRDEMARLLSLAGRYDEALSICEPSEEKPKISPLLFYRKALILSEIGQLGEAIDHVQQALELDSGMIEAWQNLAVWSTHAQQWEVAEKAVNALMRLQANDAVPYGFLGNLRMAQNYMDAAVEAYEEGVLRDPSYLYAGLRLFAIYVNHTDYQNARLRLERMKEFLTPLGFTAREAVLAIYQQDLKEARKHLQTLLESPSNQGELVNYVLGRVHQRQPKWIKVFEKLARKVLVSHSGNLNAGPALAQLCHLQGRNLKKSDWKHLPSGCESTRAALILTLKRIGEVYGDSPSFVNQSLLLSQYVRFIIQRYKAWLKEDAELWGMIGYLYFTRNQHSKVIDWMSDWHTREAVEPWMLNNFAVSLQILGKSEEYDQVLEAGLKYPVYDSTLQRFVLWAALEQAVAGQLEVSLYLCKHVNEGLFDTFDESLWSMVQLSQACLDADGVPAFNERSRTALYRYHQIHLFGKHSGRNVKQVSHLLAQKNRSIFPKIWGYFATLQKVYKPLGTLVVILWLALVAYMKSDFRRNG